MSGQAKKAPKPSERSAVRVGRASVSWGPQPYGKPGIVASAPLEAIDDLVVAVTQARERIQGAQSMSALSDRIAEVLAAELDEHGNEDDDEKRWQVARHWAHKITELFTEERRVHVPWANEPKLVKLDARPGGEATKDERRWVSPWTEVELSRQPGPYELSERVDQELYREFRERNREAGIAHDG